MSLFKVLRGSEVNLPTKKTDGWAYFCTDTGSFWIDHLNSNNILVRSKISANFADKLRYMKDEETVELEPAEIIERINAKSVKISTITLSANDWTGESNPWSQVVTVADVTGTSKIDLYPTALQMVELQDSDIALMAENNDGTITVYAFGDKPTVDYIMQATITEVVPV